MIEVVVVVAHQCRGLWIDCRWWRFGGLGAVVGLDVRKSGDEIASDVTSGCLDKTTKGKGVDGMIGYVRLL